MLDMQKFLQKYPHICFQKRWALSEDVVFRLGQCAAIIESLKYLPLAPDVREELLKVSLIKGAMATTAIEGNTLSEAEVRRIHEGTSDIAPSRKYLEQEVRNVLDALNSILSDVIVSDAISPVTTDMIRTFNSHVGRNLGNAFEAVPGRFRDNEVIVGAYRPPDHRDVGALVAMMCEWLGREFGFSSGSRQGFRTGVIEAIIAHVYLVWIHPFGDGNGRTARLLEFYLLLRSGLPDICSHALSNHYNNTRSEYYRQLSCAGRMNDLTDFISYAVQGLLDGLHEILSLAQGHQLKVCWNNYVHSQFDSVRVSKPVRKRCIALLTGMELFKAYRLKELVCSSVQIAGAYGSLTARAVKRDVGILKEHNLLVEVDGAYRINSDILLDRLPRCRKGSHAEVA